MQHALKVGCIKFMLGHALKIFMHPSLWNSKSENMSCLHLKQDRTEEHLCIVANSKLGKRSLIRHLRRRQAPQHLSRHRSKCGRHRLPLHQACSCNYPNHPLAFSPTNAASSGTLATGVMAVFAVCTARAAATPLDALSDQLCLPGALMEHTGCHHAGADSSLQRFQA